MPWRWRSCSCRCSGTSTIRTRCAGRSSGRKASWCRDRGRDDGMSRVVVVGSFNVDHVWTTAVLPRPGETLGGRYATGPGGKGFNQAVACARSGAGTTFVCALGDDPGGELARALAAGDGIDLRVLHSAEPTGTAGIYVDDEGRNCIVIGAGANAAPSPGHVAAQHGASPRAGV